MCWGGTCDPKSGQSWLVSTVGAYWGEVRFPGKDEDWGRKEVVRDLPAHSVPE